MAPSARKIPTQVRSAVREALELLENTAWESGQENGPAEPASLPSLLEQCGRLAGFDEEQGAEPVRVIHHFACTGGTLITKCLACSPNVHVLSEVDPLRSLASDDEKFAPSDLIRLVQFSNHTSSTEELIGLFLASLGVLYSDDQWKGLHLLIRDHAHSHFCIGTGVEARPTLREILERQYSIQSVVTVRDPIDSYLSLIDNKWVHFQPSTIEEYSRRYELFLDNYPDVRVFRYEDFLEDQDRQLNEICEELSLGFSEEFRDLYAAHIFSGDSGRKSNQISARPRKPIPAEIQCEIQQSKRLRRLRMRLGYERSK